MTVQSERFDKYQVRSGILLVRFAIRMMKATLISKKNDGLGLLKSRRFEIARNMSAMHDFFFCRRAAALLRLFLFMRINRKIRYYTNVEIAFDFDRKTGWCYKLGHFKKFLRNGEKADDTTPPADPIRLFHRHLFNQDCFFVCGLSMQTDQSFEQYQNEQSHFQARNL